MVDEVLESLMRRVGQGQHEAVGELYRRFAADLYQRVILPRCLDRDVADEALAETFRAVLARAEAYESHPAGPFPWLARIAVSKTVDAHRHRARTARALAGYARLVHPLLPEAPSADAMTRRREEARLHLAVHSSLGRLRPRYAEAITLRFFDELPREACAERMQVTLGNFDVLLLRAVRSLREELAAHIRDEVPA